ncbi:MAG: hypothetical protein FWE11_09115 [Defluviitaleaceae bacterium]|nr:hypothetical protein [Defluviitaleaceae bacterium]
MFKSTADFDKAVYDVLVKIRDGENWDNILSDLMDNNHTIVVEQIIKDGYVNGLMSVPYLVGNLYPGVPSITIAGLQYVEGLDN